MDRAQWHRENILAKLGRIGASDQVVTADELLPSGIGVASQARVVDATIGSVLQSGGSVRIVQAAESLDGGIGALLRWETPNSTRHAAV